MKRYVKFVIDSFADRIRVSADFLLKLFNEDDWSFVIKSNALVEAVISELLTAKAGDDRLHSLFRRLDLSNVESGKLAFAKALDLLTSEQRQFIRRLSELRNSLVHNVEGLSFS